MFHAAAIMLCLVGQAPAAPAVSPLAFDVAKLKAMPQVELKVNDSGREMTYRGVPLAAVLAGAGGTKRSMAELRSFSGSAILIRAEDDYRTIVSASAVAMDPDGRRYLLASARDGASLDASEGPFKLIVPDDPQHVRWIRNIKSIHLIRLNRIELGP